MNLQYSWLRGIQAYGIIGCFRFTESYYLLVITKREYVGSICGKFRYSTLPQHVYNGICTMISFTRG